MKNLKILFFSLLALTSIVSCVVDEEIKSKELAKTPYAVGFKRASKNVNVLLTGDVTTINEPIEILGGSDFTDTNPDIEVNLALDASSTAVEGTHFKMPNKKVVIPAGSRFVTIPIEILSQNIVVNNNKTIVLNVTSANGSVIPAANKRLTIRLIGVCVSKLAGDYNNRDVPGGQGAVITQIGNGTYKCSGLPYIGLQQGTVPVDFEFTDVCGTLTITKWKFSDDFLIQGTGTVNPTTKAITFSYIVYRGLTNTSPIFFNFLNRPSTYSPKN